MFYVSLLVYHRRHVAISVIINNSTCRVVVGAAQLVAGRYYLIKILGYLRLSAIWFIIYFKDIPIVIHLA